MLSEEEIKEYKELIAKRNEIAKEINDHIIVGREKQKQILAELKELGYESLSDLPKIQQDIAKLEEEIKASREKALEDIKSFSEQKKLLDEAMLA